MTAIVQIQAGICGFTTNVDASSEDYQNVTLLITSNCEKIQQLAAILQQHNPLDAYLEISSNSSSIILSSVRKIQTGCCAGCVVPAGIFKAMQVAAGLALAKDVELKISREE